MRGPSAQSKVAKNIRRIREERGYTQERFANHVQLDRAYYGRIERGQQNLSLRSLFMLAAFLEVRPGELLDEITVEDCQRLLSERLS